MGAAAMALIVANSPLAAAYFHFLHIQTGPVLSPSLGPMTVHLWINDALMALFFLLVGLEIKREFIDGHLASWRDRALPVTAAAGGMLIPAIIYLIVTGGSPSLMKGWAIPSATDIAFAIGVLALLGSKAPTSLKLFLTTVAIVDDMGAVAIIAVAYTASIGGPALLAAIMLWGSMLVLNRVGVGRLWPYMLLAIGLWYAILLSGIHATIAGVLAAIAIPIRRTPGVPDAIDSPLHRLETGLHPWVAYAIVPLFGFANAGVSLAGLKMADVLAPLPLGVGLGLFIGKQIGIFGSVKLAVAMGFAKRPSGATWLQTYATALLCGIGFTMSLFIAGLAFADPHLVDQAKIGILGGSLLSALAGYLLLRFAPSEMQSEN